MIKRLDQLIFADHLRVFDQGPVMLQSLRIIQGVNRTLARGLVDEYRTEFAVAVSGIALFAGQKAGGIVCGVTGWISVEETGPKSPFLLGLRGQFCRIQISGEKVKDIIAVADPGVIEEIFGGSQPIDIVLGELTGLVGICDGF